MSKEKEMALDIVSGFMETKFDDGTLSLDSWDAKKCASMYVDGMIDKNEHETHDSNRWELWVKVKQEIEKL